MNSIDPVTAKAASQATDGLIYLDYQATTPTDPRVVEAMMPFFTERFGNPASIQHATGQDAEQVVETARGEIAELIGAEPREVIFTSGATESNNLAIKGAARFHRANRPHIVTLTTEHKCVLESARRAEREGSELTILPVQPDGLVDLALLEETITERTAVVSIMAVNNEIGVIQPIEEIGSLCRAKGAYFHCDAAQAVGKVPLDVGEASIDLLSISGHKLYGPKGIGALYVRRRPRVRLQAMMDGGGQERGLRSGTLATPLCVGIGAACRIAKAEMAEEAARLERLRDRLLATLTARLEDVCVNGAMERRLPGNLNLSIEGIDAEALLASLPGLALSTGSACTSASVEPSYVLKALGLSNEAAGASLRIGLGRFTTEAEVDRAAEMLIAQVSRLRS
ncbi:MAG: IscS subfamily cysteine desulfurase [Pseudomonadota bacterium]